MRNKNTNFSLIFSYVFLIVLIAISLVSFFWTPYKIDDLSGGRLEGPSILHLLGTDKLGRDEFSRLMLGSQVVLKTGLISTAVSLIVGFPLGIFTALLKSRWEPIAGSILDSLIAFPTVLTAMLLLSVAPASLYTAILAISLSFSVVLARFTRILTLEVIHKDFYLVSKIYKTSKFQAIKLHIIPNIYSRALILLALQFGYSSIAEASLSYLGLGAPPPNASWGSVMRESQSTFLIDPIKPIIPGVFLALLMLSILTITDNLSDRKFTLLGKL